MKSGDRAKKRGWKLLKHALRRIASGENLIAVPFLEEGELNICGEELVKRARLLNADYGEDDAEYLLDHQDEIPEQIREFILVFTATFWEADGGVFMPYLIRGKDKWVMVHGWIKGGFNNTHRLVRPAA